MDKDKVKKTMSPEEATVIQNAISILTELAGMSNSENNNDSYNDNGDGMSLMKTEDKKDDDKEKENDKEDVKKATITTPTDGASANDNTVTTIKENLTDVTDDSLKQVAKALLGMTKVIKSINTKQAETDKAITNILEGLGVAKDLNVEKENMVDNAQKVVKSNVVANTDANAVKKMFKDALAEIKSESQPQNFDSQSRTVQKNLANKDVLSGLLGFKK